MNGAETMLAVIEENPISIRDGADSLSLLYWWRRQGGDGAGFAAAIGALHSQGLIAVMPGPEMRLRLTAAGFAQLDASMPMEAPAAPEPAADENEAAWRGGAAASRETPTAELVETLVGIYRLLALPEGRAVAADTLSKIWTMEGKRGGDLRTALDTMAAAGELAIQRGERTVFALTAKGSARVAAA